MKLTNTDRPFGEKCLRMEKGAITLAMSLILLFLIAFVTLAVSRNINIEQKVANSDLRSRIAFEAAETGLANFYNYLDNNGDVTLYETSGVNTGFLGEGYYEVSLDYDPDDLSSIYVKSTGYSADRSATRTITQRADKLSAIGTVPSIPLIAAGSVGQGGSYSIINPEGDTTIWSGGPVTETKNEGTDTFIADPFDPDYPSCMDTPLTCNWIETSDATTGSGLDVVENDVSLANLSTDELFVRTFGVTPDVYKSTRVTIETCDEELNDKNNDLDLSKKQVIWVSDKCEDDVNGEDDGILEIGRGGGDLTVGCMTAPKGLPQNNNIKACSTDDAIPSIVILDGDVNFNGGPHFTGVVFVRGTLGGLGGATFVGAMFSDGEGANDSSGNSTLLYHSGFLEQLTGLGPFFAASGSWRDF